MRYGSVCSGIEAASVAWRPLGWQAAWFAEIDPFCNAVLEHRFPEVKNRGDFTKITGRKRADTIDLLVGGTPCQSFSVAGRRAGLDDPRGILTLQYLRLVRRIRPQWFVWENVPGVLSDDGGRTFGAFLGIVGQLGYGWAYRVLDAQYYGLAQRRRRVFVVGYSGAWQPAAAVLFESACLRWNPSPSRKTGESVAACLRSGPPGGRSHGKLNGGDRAELIPEVASPILSGQNATGGHRFPGTDVDTVETLVPEISPTLKARDGKGPSSDGDGDGAPLIAHALRAEGFDASEDGTGRGIPIIPHAFYTNESRCDNIPPPNVAPPLKVGSNSGGNPPAIAFSDPRRHDDRHRGGVREKPCIKGSNNDLVAFTCKDSGADASELAPTLRAMGHDASHANAGGQVAAAFQQPQIVVRRLTPRECERCQGFPDDWTLVPYRGKPAADGPRYKAIGNSMAVPVMHWIGQRIGMVRAAIAAVGERKT